MILCSCHDYSLNNDSHCDCRCRCYYMQGVYAYFILPCFVLPCLVLPCLVLFCFFLVLSHPDLACLVLSCLVLTWLDEYCNYRHDVVWASVTLQYHISCSLLSSADLFSIPFDSILLYFISNRFDSILFDWI